MFSLKKVTLVVVSSLIITFYVSANDPKNISIEDNKVDFTQLLTQYDKDTDGLLSKPEVAASKHKILLDNFKNIDTNNDGGLSLAELNTFELYN